MIDAHAHVWQLERGGYDWLTPALPALFRDFDIDALHDELAAAGISRAILVQAAASAVETRWLCGLAGRADKIAGVVGWLDLNAADPLAKINDPMLVGVRAMPDAWEGTTLDDAVFDRAFDAVASAGLAFDALIEPSDLEALGRRMQRTPDLRVVIDHGGNPDGTPRWHEDLAELAALGAFTKLSGLMTLPHCTEEAHLVEVVDRLVELFPGRLLWGSDWPVLTQRCSYGAWAATARRLVSADADLVFATAAAAAYRMEQQ